MKNCNKKKSTNRKCNQLLGKPCYPVFVFLLGTIGGLGFETSGPDTLHECVKQNLMCKYYGPCGGQCEIEFWCWNSLLYIVIAHGGLPCSVFVSVPPVPVCDPQPYRAMPTQINNSDCSVCLCFLQVLAADTPGNYHQNFHMPLILILSPQNSALNTQNLNFRNMFWKVPTSVLITQF